MTDRLVALDKMPGLSELFRALTNGRHVNRVSEPALWAELEQEHNAYEALFTALGYDLRLDRRGFAWFHTDEVSTTLGSHSRKLALLFMVIFDTQADAGRPLGRFGDWVIDRDLLQRAVDRHQELLLAEQIDVDALFELLETAARYGFAQNTHGRWTLLPAVCRYLDHFEALTAEQRDQPTGEVDASPDAGEALR